MSVNQALADTAQALYESAQTHRRSSRFHRDRARELMQQLARLRESAASMGIKVIINGEGGHIHGR